MSANPIFPEDPKARKEIPIFTGCLAYFPRALSAIANQSFRGNDQHNPGTPLHWDRSKSGDEPDAMLRHYMEAKLENNTEALTACAWRILADLEKTLEAEQGIHDHRSGKEKNLG